MIIYSGSASLFLISQRHIQFRSYSYVTLKMMPFTNSYVYSSPQPVLCLPQESCGSSLLSRNTGSPGTSRSLSAPQDQDVLSGMPVSQSVWLHNFSTFFQGQSISQQWCAWNTFFICIHAPFTFLSNKPIHVKITVEW